MLRAGEVYENPVTGERAVIRIGTDITGGELLVVDLYVQPGGAVMGEPGLRHSLSEHGFTVANLSYRMIDGDKRFEYRMVIKTRDRRNAEALSRRLCELPEVLAFSIAPTGD